MKNFKAALTKLPQTIGRRLVEGAKILQKGDARTRLSCLIMGFGSLTHGQVMKGLLYFVFEISLSDILRLFLLVHVLILLLMKFC